MIFGSESNLIIFLMLILLALLIYHRQVKSTPSNRDKNINNTNQTDITKESFAGDIEDYNYEHDYEYAYDRNYDRGDIYNNKRTHKKKKKQYEYNESEIDMEEVCNAMYGGCNKSKHDKKTKYNKHNKHNKHNEHKSHRHNEQNKYNRGQF